MLGSARRMTTANWNPTRRSLLLAFGGALALSGCTSEGGDPDESRSATPTTPATSATSSPSPERTCAQQVRLHQVPDLGLKVPYRSGCGAPEPRVAKVGAGQHGSPGPLVFFDGFDVYLVPQGYREQNRQIINGRHGYFNRAEDLPDGTVLEGSTASITYAKQPYAEYTNVETRSTDYYAFITLARPPKPGHPIVTLRLAQVAESAPAPMERLRQLAEQIELL